ncbi:hypothetical protein SK128_001893, partial [Halocaridina rubra]
MWSKKICPAYGERCNYCNRLNHFESQCLEKNGHAQASKMIGVNAVDGDDSSSDTSAEYILGVKLRTTHGQPEEMTVNKSDNPCTQQVMKVNKVSEKSKYLYTNLESCNTDVFQEYSDVFGNEI